MRISGSKHWHPTFPFWDGVFTDRTFTKMPEKRPYVGEFFEEATAAVSGGIRCATSGLANYCPDVKHSEKVYSEVKSVGLSGHAILYKHRLEKDIKFQKERGKLYYWFWFHSVGVTEIDRLSELRKALGNNVKQVLVVELDQVVKWVEGREERIMNYRTIGHKMGYAGMPGWSINRTMFKERIIGETSTVLLPAVFNVEVNPVPIYLPEDHEFRLSSPPQGVTTFSGKTSVNSSEGGRKQRMGRNTACDNTKGKRTNRKLAA